MSEILNTKYGTYDLNDRKSAYIYFCQNFGFHSRDMSLIEQYFITEYEELEKEIEKLQKQNEKLKNALSYYCAHQLYKPIIGMKLDEKTSKLIYEMGSIARKTLEELDNDPAS